MIYCDLLLNRNKSITRKFGYVNSFAGKSTNFRGGIMFSSLLKDLRMKNGLTQGQLAKAAGVSPGNVGDWETGKSKPGYNALASLARIFDVSADYLLEINTTPAKTSVDLDAYKTEHGLTCDGSPLDDIEADLIAMFRLLPSYEREDFFDIIYFKYKKHVEKKAESIYWTYTEDRNETKNGPISSRESRDGTA